MKLHVMLASGAIAIGLAAAAVAQPSAPSHEATHAAAARMLANGYLGQDRLPDSLALNPPPPARGTVAAIRDEEAAGSTMALRGSARWEQARIDADLFTPTATASFSCAAGLAISSQTTPRLDSLLRRAAADLARAVYPTKQKYQRARPFTVNGNPTCTPEMDEMLRKDGSYPSGHSAIGYGWGLLLAEIVPDRATQLVSRGRGFGDSRRVCNVHWLSDVEEGRVVATAVVARLHADPAFEKDLKKVKQEVAKARRKGTAPDCTRENAAFASR